ncbi:hypothetical protein J6590_042086 [Homalodisca vitripennis]|nr:hypothetical protein J6590_042086 [Homalodisca vitripennis]
MNGADFCSRDVRKKILSAAQFCKCQLLPEVAVAAMNEDVQDRVVPKKILPAAQILTSTVLQVPAVAGSGSGGSQFCKCQLLPEVAVAAMNEDVQDRVVPKKILPAAQILTSTVLQVPAVAGSGSGGYE